MARSWTDFVNSTVLEHFENFELTISDVLAIAEGRLIANAGSIRAGESVDDALRMAVELYELQGDKMPGNVLEEMRSYLETARNRAVSERAGSKFQVTAIAADGSREELGIMSTATVRSIIENGHCTFSPVSGLWICPQQKVKYDIRLAMLVKKYERTKEEE